MAKANYGALPTAERLKEVFSYADGQLIFKWRDVSDFPHEKYQRIWNTKYAGKVAGTVDKDGRLAIRVDGVTYYAHRIIWKMQKTGPVPSIIDHADGDPLNNKVDNLRAATHSKNMANSKERARKATNCVGLPRGVYSVGNRFKAQVSINGSSKHLGSFISPEMAKIARDMAVGYMYGDFARYANGH